MLRSACAFAALVFCLVASPRAGAAPADPPAPALGASPRAMLAEFQAACRAGRYDDAARYLDLGVRSPSVGRRLAHRLGDVIEQIGPLDPEDLSPQKEGDTEDDLPADRDLAGHFSIPGGASEPITLVRHEGSPAWQFSRGTVARADAWWALLPARFLVERLPASLLRRGPFGLALWQLLALPAAAVLAILIGLALGWLTGRAMRRLDRLDPDAPAQLSRPLRWAWVLLVARVLIGVIGLPAGPHAFAVHVLRIGFWLVAWSVIAAVIDLLRMVISRAPWAAANPGSRSLMTLGGRAMQLVVFLFACVGALAELGLPVTSLVAGLGVGGLGLALAAQKTVENLFGAFSLGVDQPFREGDLISVEGVTGTVERIGLRSTRIRTADRTIVAIPNGKLAEMKTESLAARDRYRLQTTLSLSHGTPVALVREVLERAETMLRTHEKVFPDVQVRLRALSLASIEIDVSATFRSSNIEETLQIRQDLLLSLLELTEAREISLGARVPPPSV